MRGWTLGSGSRGNGIVLESAGRRLLVDCGFGPRSLAGRLNKIGVDPESIEAVLVTHEHQDHAQGVERAQKKWRWPVYSSSSTLDALPDVSARWRRTIAIGETTETDAFTIESISIPHDASAPLAYVVTARSTGVRVGIAHDLGAVPEGFREQFARCDVLCIEANHDVDMLLNGPYPRMLQQRIRGGRGHLNNTQTGQLIADLVSPSLRHIVLLHLSETNNTPQTAVDTIRPYARRAGFRGTIKAAAGRVPEEGFVVVGAQSAQTGHRQKPVGENPQYEIFAPNGD